MFNEPIPFDIASNSMGVNQSMVNQTDMVGITLKNDVVLFEDDRTFFCSELIAKAFKVIGVIQNDETSCTRFYPKHFSKEGESFLKLK